MGRRNMSVRKHFDPWSMVVIVITLVLFFAALFFTGFTHDLLLEAGVFLVSVKLILMAYKSSVSNDAIREKLDDIHRTIERLEDLHSTLGGGGSTGDRRPSSGAPGRTSD